MKINEQPHRNKCKGAISGYPTPIPWDPSSAGSHTGPSCLGPCSPVQLHLPTHFRPHLLLSRISLLHTTIQSTYSWLVPLLMPCSLIPVLLAWPSLFFTVPFAINHLTFWGGTAGPLWAHRASPPGSQTAFRVGKVKSSTLEGFPSTG